MWKKFKIMFNKEEFDYSTGHVNPLEFHSTVYFLTKSYGVLDESIFMWSGLLQGFMVCCLIPGLVFCALGIYHGLQILDAAVLIETGTYLIVLSYKLCILTIVRQNIQDFHSLMRVLRDDFSYVCTDGNKYRKGFFQNQLHTWKICIFVTFAMSIICFGMVSAGGLSLLYYVVTHRTDSDGRRPLFFPFWAFDVDFNKSPNYELAFIYSEIYVLAYGYNYIFMITTQILWIREIATKADLVKWQIQDLMCGVHPANNDQEAKIFADIIKYRMRAIIQQHHSMYELIENYSRVFKKLLMFEQTFCGPVVCLTAYSAAEKLEEGELNFILILLCVASVIVAAVPSYFCTFLRIKVSSVVDACFDTRFWNAGSVLRPYFVLIIQRSLRPLPLSFGGFKEVSLETFANKMTSAYSCFNMLRQAFK